MRTALMAALLCAVAIPSTTEAQQTGINQSIAGTRLDIAATGEATRVPDVATISAGVVSHSASASAAMSDAADRMDRVRAALKRAGIEDRAIQTTSISLNPEYRYPDNQAPQLTGYTAAQDVAVRFRDIRNSGKILDALVGQGANQINGPNLTIDQPDSALDEARANAVAIGRARAQLYARSLGMRVARLVSVSESGGYAPPAPAPPQPMMMARAAATKIDSGEQKLQVSVAMVFELQ